MATAGDSQQPQADQENQSPDNMQQTAAGWVLIGFLQIVAFAALVVLLLTGPGARYHAFPSMFGSLIRLAAPCFLIWADL
jgi:hypothetical protein